MWSWNISTNKCDWRKICKIGWISLYGVVGLQPQWFNILQVWCICYQQMVHHYSGSLCNWWTWSSSVRFYFCWPIDWKIKTLIQILADNFLLRRSRKNAVEEPQTGSLWHVPLMLCNMVGWENFHCIKGKFHLRVSSWRPKCPINSLNIPTKLIVCSFGG